MRNLVRLYQHLSDATNSTAVKNAIAAAKPPIISKSKLVLLIVVASLILLFAIVAAVWLYVRRKRAYEDYNKRPETFIRKPSDSQIERIEESEETFMKEIYYNNASKLTDIKSKNFAEGRIYEITFYPAGGSSWCSVRFSRLLEETCYFEVELMSTKGEIMIGYGWESDIDKRFDRKSDIGSVAVGFSSLGRIKNNGVLVDNYLLPGNYGDCIGIGITKEDMRVWFTYNGVLLNEPTSAEQDRWFKQNVEQQLEKQKRKRKARGFIDKLLGRKQKKQKASNPIALKAEHSPRKQKDDVRLQRQKVALHHNIFAYKAFVSCTTDDVCPVLVNVGGQAFRFPQHEFKEGLYRQKDESESDELVQQDGQT